MKRKIVLDEHTVRRRHMDLWARLRRRGVRPQDVTAVAIVVCYAMLALSTQAGASIAGQGLDPVWAAAQQRGALRVATDFGFYPFTDLRRTIVDAQERDEPAGYDIDLAQAVARKLGLRAEFVPTSQESVYEDLAAGKADMVASALPYAPEQGWRASFSTFYFNAGQVLIVPEDSPIVGQGQLGGATIGVPLGSDADTYARQLATGNSSIEVRSEYDTPSEVLADLRRGQLDAAIVDNAAALIEMGRQPGLRFVPPALTLEPYVLAVPLQAFQLQGRINQALEELRNEGFFERNGEKWFSAATPQK